MKEPSIFKVLHHRAEQDDYSDMVGVFSTAEEIVDFLIAHPRKQEPGVKRRTFGLSNIKLR